MGTIGTTYLNLLDWAKRQKPTGGVDTIIETVTASNPILADANVMEGNLPTGHQYTRRTTEPTGTWRKLNYGVTPEKSLTDQFTDFCGILEAYSKVDIDVAKLNGDERAFRASEDLAFISGLSSSVATAIFYGNQGSDPEQPQGLAPRYNSLSTGYYNYTVAGDGSGNDNTSIWLVTWGEKTCSLIYPKGSQAGLVTTDLGKQVVTDSSGREYLAYMTQFQWKVGLAVMDYRYVIRICNIDYSNLTDDAATGTDLMRKMVSAFYKRPSQAIAMEDAGMAKAVWYCNKSIAEYLHVQASNKSNVNLTLDEAAGRKFPRFLGAPIHVCDNLTVAEATVS